MIIETEISKGMTAEELNKVVAHINANIASLREAIQHHPILSKPYSEQIQALENARFIICLHAGATLQFEDLEAAS
ncbi:hypothetical protein [Cerasicoccus fimbriatus]|uniref:hypothetical protein n=1 Tax=Cerasicoccus fimbriatus TaxID=3014554 RepID=UPI0022B378E8|nr:hypothetical protein [Cerasicoccus sp. TK19100]